jgi:hypothetical protein
METKQARELVARELVASTEPSFALGTQTMVVSSVLGFNSVTCDSVWGFVIVARSGRSIVVVDENRYGRGFYSGSRPGKESATLEKHHYCAAVVAIVKV